MIRRREILIPEEITPGSVLGFRGLPDITDFEDVVIVPHAAPHFDTETWDEHPPFRDIVEPDPKIFQGRLHDITLTAQEKPLEWMEKVRAKGERQFTISAANRLNRLLQMDRALMASCLGFTFRAMASSSRKTNIGYVEVGLLYAPVTTGIEVGTELPDVCLPIWRIATLPFYDRKAFESVYKSSSRMGAVAANSGSPGPGAPRQNLLKEPN